MLNKIIFSSFVSAIFLFSGSASFAQEVGTNDIQNGAVTRAKIKNGAVGTAQIGNQQVNRGKLANGAVGTAQLGNNQISTNKLQDEAVTVSKVAPPLKNSIGSSCSLGAYVVGIDSDGNLICEVALGGSPGDWVEFNFTTPGQNVTNSCDSLLSKKYVRISDFGSFVVGAQVCDGNEFRYKLFLAESLFGQYFEMGDTAGDGEDHCEVIGQPDGTVGNTVIGDDADPGAYVRDARGEAFTFLTSNTGNRSAWYECGISIPAGNLPP